MLNGFSLLWLISIFSISSSTVLYITNEKYELIQFAHDIAVINHINPEKFIRLINCESQFEYAFGDYRSETGEHMAHGPAQWWLSSWNKYKNLYDMEYLNYKNSKDQIVLAAVVIGRNKKGIFNWYNCGKKIGMIE